MRIHIGCELTFELPQTTPMIATLHVHFSRVSGFRPGIKLPSNESAEIQAFSKFMKHIAKLRGARNTLHCFKSNQREAISASMLNC